MLYDLGNELSRIQFKRRCNQLYQAGAVVELTEKRTRSLSQNSYLHVALTYFAKEYGESLEFVKQQFFKKAWNPDLFIRRRQDRLLGDVPYLRSSADLSKEEMTLAIERFRNHASSDAGIYIPSADEKDLVALMEDEVRRYERYL